MKKHTMLCIAFAFFQTFLSLCMQKEDVVPSKRPKTHYLIPTLKQLCLQKLEKHLEQEWRGHKAAIAELPVPQTPQQAQSLIAKCDDLQRNSELFKNLLAISSAVPPTLQKLLTSYHLVGNFCQENPKFLATITTTLLRNIKAQNLSHEFQQLNQFLCACSPATNRLLNAAIKRSIAWRSPYVEIKPDYVITTAPTSTIPDLATLSIYSAELTNPVCKLFNSAIRCVSPAGNRVAVVSNDNRIHILKVAGTKIINDEYKCYFMGKKPTACAFSQDGSCFIAGFEAGSLQRLNLTTRTIMPLNYPTLPPITRSLRQFSITTVKYCPNNRFLVAGCNEGALVLWNAQTGKEKKALFDLQEIEYEEPGIWITKPNSIATCAFSPCSSLLAAAGENGKICLWTTNDWSLVIEKFKHEKISAIAISHDCSLMLSGSQQGSIKLWDLKHKRLIRTLVGLGDPVQQVAFAPNGQSILFAQQNGNIHALKLQELPIYESCALYAFNQSLRSGKKNECEQLLSTPIITRLPLELQTKLKKQLSQQKK